MKTLELKQARWIAVKKVLFWATVPLLVAAFLTWRWYDARYPSWQEEVRLSDGRVIAIKQKRDYIESYGTQQSWITFSLPEMGGERTWHSYLMPMVVDVSAGSVYLIGRPRGPRQYDMYQAPKYFIVAFQWNGKDFKRVPVMSVPEQVRQRENVYPCLPPNNLRRVSIQDKITSQCGYTTNERIAIGERIDLEYLSSVSQKYASDNNSKPRSE